MMYSKLSFLVLSLSIFHLTFPLVFAFTIQGHSKKIHSLKKKATTPLPSTTQSTINIDTVTNNQGKNDIIDPAGPSIELLNLAINDKITYSRITNDDDSHERTFQVTKISSSPYIFLFQNLLSIKECQSLMNSNYSDNNGDNDANATRSSVHMSAAGVTEGHNNVRSNCEVGWIPNNHKGDNKDKPSLPLELGRIVGNILMTDEAKMNGWCESLQLVHYNSHGGRFDLHYDGLYRSITVIYYLNGVGNTWFPFAINASEKDRQSHVEKVLSTIEPPSNREEALKVVSDLGLEPGKHGVLAAGKKSKVWEEISGSNKNVIRVETGDAIAFFNYKHDSGDSAVGVERDWRSLHAGLATTSEEGEKWIANHWIHHLPFSEDWATLESAKR